MQSTCPTAKGNQPFLFSLCSQQFKEALEQAMDSSAVQSRITTSATNSKHGHRWGIIVEFLHDKGVVTNADIQKLFDISPATVNCVLNGLVLQEKLVGVHHNGHWAYEEYGNEKV